MVFTHTGKPICAHLVCRKFCGRCRFWNCSSFCLIDDGTSSSSQGRISSAYFFYAFLLQAIDGGNILGLCPQVMFQAPQHVRSFESLAICDACLQGHFPSLRNTQDSTSTGVFESGCQPSSHASLDFPFHLQADWICLFNGLCLFLSFDALRYWSCFGMVTYTTKLCMFKVIASASRRACQTCPGSKIRIW